MILDFGNFFGLVALLPSSVVISLAMTIRAYALAGLGAICIAGVLLAQGPRADNLSPPGLATPNFSQAVLKPPNVQLKVPPGFSVSAYAEGLPGVRWMQVAPNGDLFVSQYNRSTITVLRDTHNEGKPPNLRMVYANGIGGGRRDPQGDRGGARRGPPNATPPSGFLTSLVDTAAAAIPCVADVQLPPGTTGIQNPMGMAFRNGYFYVANTDGIIRYKYTLGDLEAPPGDPQKVADLPGGGFHGWRNIVFNRAGTKMYVTVGSASNNRAGEDCRRAAILEMNADGSGARIFASGLRNPEGLAWQPGTNRLWTVVNERDSLGDDLVPDFFTSVKEGGFYGWPYSYIGQHYDPRYVGGQPELVRKAIVPDVLIPAHSAPLGLTFYTADQFPMRYRNGAFIALHGSWNRSKASGYKVVFVPFVNGMPGPMEDFMTGFLLNEGGRNPDGSMAPIIQWGRPVGVAVGRDGSLLVTDDQGGRIWQVKYKNP
jgi:glucose/arabinose dehydrogenase